MSLPARPAVCASAPVEPLEARTLCSTVAYWRFENGSANAAASGTSITDSSGNGHTGTAVGGPVYSSSVPVSAVPQTGEANARSLSFNGTSQRVTVPDANSFQLTKSLTIEAWIYAKNPNGNEQQILFRGDDRAGNDPYNLEVFGSQAWFRIAGTSKSDFVAADFTNYFNKWTHVAGTLDDATGKMSLYFNGTLAASTTTDTRPAAVLTGAKPGLGIGGTQSDTYFGGELFDGLIDEVRLSNTALSPSSFLRSPGGTSGGGSTGTLTGQVFNDRDGSGTLGSGEAKLAGRTVFLDTNKNGKLDGGEKSATTAADGSYRFAALAKGTYRVAEVVPSGWLATTSTSADVTISGGATTTKNFGQARPVTVSGSVFNDKNDDGDPDTGESGLSGWKVFIDADNDGVADSGEKSVTTDKNGNYTLTGLTPGTFTVRVVAAGGYSATDGASIKLTGYGGTTVAGLTFGFAK